MSAQNVAVATAVQHGRERVQPQVGAGRMAGEGPRQKVRAAAYKPRARALPREPQSQDPLHVAEQVQALNPSANPRTNAGVLRGAAQCVRSVAVAAMLRASRDMVVTAVHRV